MGWNYLSITKLQRLHRWSLRMDKQFDPTHYNGGNYLSMLGLKLIHVSKRDSGLQVFWEPCCLLATELLNIIKQVPASRGQKPSASLVRDQQLNTFRQRQNGHHFADLIFKFIFFNENLVIFIKISLKFVPKGSINVNPALVLILWHGTKQAKSHYLNRWWAS